MSLKSRFLFSMAVVVISVIIAMLVRVEKPGENPQPAPVAEVSQAAHPDGGTPVNRHEVYMKQWLIEPGKRVGPITKASTLADLQKAYGQDAVKETRVHIGEGETVSGAVLFAGDPEKELYVVWKADKTAESVRIEGEKSVWHTEEGISLGTPLKTLEDLNEEPFTLAGFGWDYSGTVLSWQDGWLEDRLQKQGGVVLRLNPDEADYENPAYNQVTGDTDFSSAHPAMQKLNPKVSTIIVVFE